MTSGDERSLDWNTTYDLGYARIDGEHRYLLRLAQEALEAISNNPSTQVHGLAQRFLEACRYHFFSEEELMHEIGYEQVDMHVKYHTKLLTMAESVVAECARTDDPTSLRAEFISLAQCLLDDVIAGDRELIPYLHAKGLIAR